MNRRNRIKLSRQTLRTLTPQEMTAVDAAGPLPSVAFDSQCCNNSIVCETTKQPQEVPL
jgi:hypothetical protein